MINNLPRVGNFTSSEIVALTKKDKKGGFGAPALTYIEETNFERRLGRSLTTEVDAKPLTWGKLLEIMAFDELGLEYVLSSTETDVHPEITYWAGSKDGLKMDDGRTVIDIKSPFTLKSFCQLVQPLYDGLTGMAAMDWVRENHKDGDKYYWQLVSNAILNNAKHAELIPFMPYKSQLEDLRMRASNVPAEVLSKHYFIAMANDDDLPYLPDGGYYKNINKIRFEVPQADKDLLTSLVVKAGELLVSAESPSVFITERDSQVGATIINDATALKI